MGELLIIGLVALYVSKTKHSFYKWDDCELD